jgi:hypothetical protein
MERATNFKKVDTILKKEIVPVLKSKTKAML